MIARARFVFLEHGIIVGPQIWDPHRAGLLCTDSVREDSSQKKGATQGIIKERTPMVAGHEKPSIMKFPAIFMELGVGCITDIFIVFPGSFQET